MTRTHSSWRLTREIESSDPDEIETRTKAFEIAWELAVMGPDAVTLIQRVAVELRREYPQQEENRGVRD